MHWKSLQCFWKIGDLCVLNHNVKDSDLMTSVLDLQQLDRKLQYLAKEHKRKCSFTQKIYFFISKSLF